MGPEDIRGGQGGKAEQRGWVTEWMRQLSGCGWCIRGRRKSSPFSGLDIGFRRNYLSPSCLPSPKSMSLELGGIPLSAFITIIPRNSETGSWGTQFKLQGVLTGTHKKKVSGWLKSSFRFSHSSLWKNRNELFGQPNTLKMNFCKLILGTVHYLGLSINLENKIYIYTHTHIVYTYIKLWSTLIHWKAYKIGIYNYVTDHKAGPNRGNTASPPAALFMLPLGDCPLVPGRSTILMKVFLKTTFEINNK